MRGHEGRANETIGCEDKSSALRKAPPSEQPLESCHGRHLIVIVLCQRTFTTKWRSPLSARLSPSRRPLSLLPLLAARPAPRSLRRRCPLPPLLPLRPSQSLANTASARPAEIGGTGSARRRRQSMMCVLNFSSNHSNPATQHSIFPAAQSLPQRVQGRLIRELRVRS